MKILDFTGLVLFEINGTVFQSGSNITFDRSTVQLQCFSDANPLVECEFTNPSCLDELGGIDSCFFPVDGSSFPESESCIIECTVKNSLNTTGTKGFISIQFV